MRFLLLLLLTAPVWADLSPPEGSFLVGAPANLTLRWPGSPTAKYSLELLNGTRVAWSGNVTGNSHSFKEMAYGYYRWRVSSAAAPSNDFHSFTLLQDTQFDFNGSAGSEGYDGAGLAGGAGAVGGPGSPGQSIAIDLTPEGEFVNVLIKAGTRQQFLFLPGAAPLVINARGGAGGGGGDGGSGSQGYTRVVRPGQGSFSAPTGPGGPGGAGGDGGAGGSVSIHERGVDVAKVLQIHVEGGAPGKGGKGGAGGVVSRWTSPGEPQSPVRGPNGKDGTPGRDGTVRY